MPFQKGNKYGGSRRRTSAIVRTPVPRLQSEVSDEEMADADDTRDVTPTQDEDEVEGEEREDDEAEEEEEEEEDDDDEPVITAMPPRKNRGKGKGSSRRSMRAERVDYGTPRSRELDEVSESGTPVRRRRGRPEGSGRGRGRGGFRGRRKGQRVEAPSVVIDKDGNTLEVIDDEVQVDNDEEGNEKVDANGILQGGREYRVRTFTIIDKEDRMYMLSTEPARCCGFRDSYLFFAKHPKLYKVLLNEEQKKDLIDRDVLPNSYKGRNIAVVTARSVFREFGARIIVGGRKVIDDYKVTEAREKGDVEGELADPDDRVPEKKGEYNRNRYVAWFGASEVYRNVGQGTGAQGSKPGLLGKRRTNVTVENWQVMHAREASRFNSSLAAMRHANLEGVYDTHTNLMFYPKIMQPTHARWEHISPSSTHEEPKAVTNGLTNGYHANSVKSVKEEEASMRTEDARLEESAHTTIFSDVPEAVSRNFVIIDTQYTAPPLSSIGYPGPDGIITDPASGSNGLSSISPDLLDELPDECRRAFEFAKKTELGWKNRWGTEAQSALRGDLKIGFSGYPV